MAKSNNTTSSSTIALNKKAKHDYSLGDRFEAGMALSGWEVKSLRAKQVQLRDSYVIFKNSEAFIIGAIITPLATTNRVPPPDPTRTRKLLLNRKELAKLETGVKRKQYTIVPTAMYWKNGRAKLEIAMAVGKKSHDKRAALKDADWQRQQQRILRSNRR